MKKRVLVVDDEKNIRRTLGMILTGEGFDVSDAESAEAGLDLFRREGADVVLLDLNLPGIDGIEALRVFKRTDPECMVVMISGQGTVSAAAEATREGAFDFLEKPVSKERVLVAVRNALSLSSMGREWREMKSREKRLHVMVGDGPAMARVREDVARAAPTSARVLILGESGTGKELVARSVHEASERRNGPFVKVNCAAIPEELIESELFGAVKGAYTGAESSRDGKFLQASGGTLFLDEIGDMSLKAQAKVLRALQENEIEKVGGSETIPVDVRVLAATNKDLEREVQGGAFREDLWFRLNVVPIVVPPLRERREDIPKLVRHYVERFRSENNRPPVKLADEALTALSRRDWPGNVRELANAIERLTIMTPGPSIELEDLERTGLLEAVPGPRSGPKGPGTGAADAESIGGSTIAGGLSPREMQRVGGLVAARREFEAECIRECLRATSGNISAAARLLGLDRTNLHKKITSLGIETERGAT